MFFSSDGSGPCAPACPPSRRTASRSRSSRSAEKISGAGLRHRVPQVLGHVGHVVTAEARAVIVVPAPADLRVIARVVQVVTLVLQRASMYWSTRRQRQCSPPRRRRRTRRLPRRVVVDALGPRVEAADRASLAAHTAPSRSGRRDPQVRVPNRATRASPCRGAASRPPRSPRPGRGGALGQRVRVLAQRGLQGTSVRNAARSAAFEPSLSWYQADAAIVGRYSS